MNYVFDQFAYALGPPQTRAHLRQSAEDFRVDEHLGFSLSGSGQHVWLKIEKRHTNTEWLARQLAKCAGVSARDVGYAGLKDRNAVTTQWFSVDLAGRPAPDWPSVQNDDIRILEIISHGRKLRRGAHAANRFVIVLRDLVSTGVELDARLQQVRTHGVPNYFAEQRFGRGFQNLTAAQELFNGSLQRVRRHQRSLYLSAARSWIFNALLSCRVNQRNWCTALPGDVLMLRGSKAFFHSPEVDDEIVQRIEHGDVFPSGPLWGSGDLPSSGLAAELESITASQYKLFCDGLVKFGLKQQRRSLVLLPEDMSWQRLSENSLLVEFTLPSGGFATSVIRELAVVSQENKG